MSKEVDLEGMPPIKKARKRVKKHHTTKNVPVEVSIRRQLSEELGDDEPTKDEKFVLLQKYGITAPRIDRLVTKSNWMGVAEWKRKQNFWFEGTKGLVKAQQRPRFRPTPTSQQSQSQTPQGRPSSTLTRPWREPYPKSFPANLKPVGHRPWSQIKHKRDSRLNSGTIKTETPRS